MKFPWRVIREALNAAARSVAVRIVVALLAGLGAVDLAEDVAAAAAPPASSSR